MLITKDSRNNHSFEFIQLKPDLQNADFRLQSSHKIIAGKLWLKESTWFFCREI